MNLSMGINWNSQKLRQAAIGLLFIAPAVISCLIFDWYPMFEGVYRAFYKWDGYKIAKWIGVQNFVDIYNDEIFWGSIGNMLFFLIAGLVLMAPTIIASIVLFHVNNQRMQFLYRVLFCIPMVVPYMVILLMWQFMYNPQYGFFNRLLEIVGLGAYQQTWLGDPDLAKWCLVFMGFPWVSTNAALIYMGGLKSIDTSIWEAAKMDGVGPLSRLFKLELPLIMGQIKLNLIGVVVGAITGFSTQLILTKGGPGFATMVPGLYMYNSAFRGKQYGYAAALGLVLFAISLLITLATLKFLKGEEDSK